jgi:hypothetical protein
MLLSNPRVLVDISGGGYIGTYNPGYMGLRVCRTNLLSGACSLHTGSHVVLCGYQSEPHLYTGLFQIDDAGDCLQANPATGDCQCDVCNAAAGIWRANVEGIWRANVEGIWRANVEGIWRANVDAAPTWRGSNIGSRIAAACDAAPAALLSSASDALQISGMYQHMMTLLLGAKAVTP